MQETLHDHHIFISIGGWPICKLRFANDTDIMDGSNGELHDLRNILVDRARAYDLRNTRVDRARAYGLRNIP